MINFRQQFYVVVFFFRLPVLVSWLVVSLFVVMIWKRLDVQKWLQSLQSYHSLYLFRLFCSHVVMHPLLESLSTIQVIHHNRISKVSYDHSKTTSKSVLCRHTIQKPVKTSWCAVNNTLKSQLWFGFINLIGFYYAQFSYKDCYCDDYWESYTIDSF